MKHAFVQHLPFCRHCGMLFNDHREFSTVCPGQLVDEPLAPGVPPPTPLPIRASPAAQPGPRVMWALSQALELAREHYEAGSKLSEAEGVMGPRNQRAMARSLCRRAGGDPDAMVIAPGLLPRTPKGAILLGFHLFNVMPYWVLFLADARETIEAAEAAKDGREFPDGELSRPEEAVERV